MSSCGDDDRHRGHLGVSQTNKAKKKKSARRPMDPEDIPGSIFSAPERISHDTHLFVVPFVQQILDNIILITVNQSVLPLLQRHCLHNAMRAYLYRLFVDHDSYRQVGYQMVLHLPQRFVHPSVSPSSTAAPSATRDVAMPTLAPGQKDKLGRVMIEPDGSSLCVLGNREKFKAISEQAKKARGNLKGGSLHTGGAKTVGTITREMEKELRRTPIEQEVFKKTHVKKKENEGLEGIGSSRQVEILDGVQIAFMLAQIEQLTSALAESKWRRVVEQQSMSATVQQIKEQVLNLACRPTTSAPEDTDDNSEEEDDFVDVTP
ncbi:hypothetical protein MTR67_023356 [Solanum verrucosum]|uniref:Uncharacterized protein n=1 Tax=Solanum verrucosum TaxID=315347 RepID=A0AAF0QV18_SOLVR|nr:hypothetical protein MTR67_023356 [Solanum verrucosum]